MKLDLRIGFLAASIALVISACAGGQGSSNGNLVVFDWSGYELPEFWQPFADQHPDTEVDFSFFAEDAEAFAKSQTGFEYDLVHPCSNYWQLYVDNGLVQPIDTSRLSNWSGVYKNLASQGEFDGQQYFIPWEWGYESVLVRSDLVENVPTSWADLWNEEYAGHVSIFDSGETAHVLTAVALGLDPWNTTAAEDEIIKQKLIDLKPNLLTFWGDYTEINQLVASGDVWLAGNTWNDAFVALNDEGIPVEYIVPEEGRLGWVCGYGISSKASNLDLAYDYLNALLAPESMAEMANAYGYGASNAEALPLMDEYLVTAMQLESPSILDSTIFYQSITEEQRQKFTDMWSEVKAAP